MKKLIRLWMLLMPMVLGIAACTSDSEELFIPSTDSSTDSSTDPSTEPEQMAEYTIMWYSVGGGNLDTSQQEDWMRAMQSFSEADGKVNMVCEFKYSSEAGLTDLVNKGGVPLGDPGQVYRFSLAELQALVVSAGGGMGDGDDEDEDEDEEIPDISSLEYGEQGAAAEMYQPDSLASFIRYCQQVAPAHHYILVFSDHGGGYNPLTDYDKGNLTRGLLQDDNLNGSPMLSCKEIRAGLERSGLHPKMVYFDCCLMNSIETISELQGLTDYVLASGHTIYGGNYEQLVRLLAQAATDGDFLSAVSAYGEAMIQRHKDVYAAAPDDHIAKYVDMVLTDMEKLPAVYEPLRRFVTYAVDHYNAAKAPLYDIPAQGCYQYYNQAPLYDIMDYLMMLDVAAFSTVDGDGNIILADEPTGMLHEFYDAVQEAQLFHYYTSDINKDYDLTYSVNLGALGAMPQMFGGTDEDGRLYDVVLCSDGRVANRLWGSSELSYTGRVLPYTTWDNSYNLLEFDRLTGWSQWMMLNPSFPEGNPPTDDENDHIR